MMYELVKRLVRVGSVEPGERRDRQRGAAGGIAEQAIALLVGAGAAAIALAGGASLLTDSNVQSQISELTSLQIRMRNGHAAIGSDYGSAEIDASEIIAAGYAPSSMVQGTNLRSRWRSDVTITGAGATFWVEIAAVPQEDCVGLLQQVQPPIVVGARAAATAGGLAGATDLTVPAARSAAVSACAGAANSVRLIME